MSTLLKRSLLLLALSAALITASAAPATAASKRVSLRVVGPDGQTLTQNVQYTKNRASVRTSKKADCFGGGGSGKTVHFDGTTALGALADASRFTKDLRPLWITDEFSFGLAICAIGGFAAPPGDWSTYWFVKRNHKALQVGADQQKVRKGDEILYALTATPAAELALKAPRKATPGVPYTVKVIEYGDDGTAKPAQGASVTGAVAPTNAAGETTVTSPAGRHTLQATRSSAIPSNEASVCVAADSSACGAPPVVIYGTGRSDSVRGTRGDNKIRTGGGNDRITLRGGSNNVRCGRGRFDTVYVKRGDRDDAIGRDCERVRRV